MRDLREAFHDVLAAPDAGALLAAVLSHVAKVEDVSREELQRIVRVELGPKLEAAMTSTYDQVLNEGREQGREQGRAEGVLQGRATSLLVLLEKRFGLLPAPALARVTAADSAALDRWLLRILEADTLDEVFTDG